MLKIIYIKIIDETDYQQWKSFLYSVLLDEELAEIERFKNQKRKIEHLLGIVISRIFVSYFFSLQLKDVQFTKTEHGKPFCKGLPEVHFNISHGGDYVVAAFSDSSVGIDVESLRRKVYLQVAKHHFSPIEWQQLEQVEENEKKQLFYKFWTVKESYLKMLGTGLTRSLSSFDVKFEHEMPVIYENENRLTCHLSHFFPDMKHVISVCTQNGYDSIQYNEISMKDLENIIKHGKL